MKRFIMINCLFVPVLKIESYPLDGVDKTGVFTIREMHEAENFKDFY